MKTRWIRIPPTRRDEVASAAAAGILAGAVGAATYYLVRTLLARERLEGPEQGPERLPERTGGDA